MAPPLIIRIITDAAEALKTNKAVISSNTAVGRSALAMGADFEKSAAQQVAIQKKTIELRRAELASMQQLARASVATGDERIAINNALAASEKRLAAVTGVSVVGVAKTGEASKTAKKDVDELTRGLLAGSGAASKLGRSLAFASTGFIAIAAGATVISESIHAAEEQEAAQRRLEQQLKVSGKTWERYGAEIDKTLAKEGHLAGFTRTEMLGAFTFLLRVGGNVSNSLRLVGLAADVARGRSITLQAASIALSKALGGSATALRRLGIIVPNNVSKMAALNYVQEKFTGQARAGTTAAERFHAALVDTGAVIGTELLPTFERLANRFSNWLRGMQETGQLKKDLDDIGKLFGLVGKAIEGVDKVTGSFVNTLKLLLALKIASMLGKLVGNLDILITKWKGVTVAATEATAAEERAFAASGGGGGNRNAPGGGPGVPLIVPPRVLPSRPGGVVGRVGEYTGGARGLAAIGTAGTIGLTIGAIGGGMRNVGQNEIVQKGDRLVQQVSVNGKVIWHRDIATIPGKPVITEGLRDIGRGGDIGFLQGLIPGYPGGPPRPGGMTSAYGRAPRSSYEVPTYLQVQQAQAELTASVKDDVSIARRIIKNIKRIIDRGNYTQKGLLDLLQAEAAALGVIQSAAQAAAQKRAAEKAAAEARASTFEIPHYLQLAQAKAEAYGKDETAILKKIIAAAEAAIRRGGKNWKGLIAAYQAIGAARAALAQDAEAALIPLRLQLRLAKAQALGGDVTAILLKMRAALYRALKAAKGNIQKQIDIWNQIAQINEQLGNSITSAYGDYKKASLKAEVEGLGLTAAQTRLLEYRLSQRGPGGTVPGEGTGAAGYVIDPETGRPVRHRRHHHPGHSGNVPGGGGGGSSMAFTLRQTINVNVDGKRIARVITKHQQTYRSQNPSSRRGPHAATATA